MTDSDRVAARAELNALLKVLDKRARVGFSASEDWQVPVPKPGSADAVALGCTCPVLDNGHGKGRGDGNFWVNGDCPLHGFSP